MDFWIHLKIFEVTMRIITCIKQVPGTSQVDIDEETGVLKRSGVPSKMNPYDQYALETALRLKEELGGEVVVITMGPPQSRDIIREAYLIGADKGILLSDSCFAGSDVLATSYTIASAIDLIKPYDVIICGKQTTDGDTGQVGPSIAEHLDIPHISWVTNIRSTSKEGLIVEHNMTDSAYVSFIKYPCLITVEKNIFTPRLPSYKKMLESKTRETDVFNVQKFPAVSEDRFGLLGSPTQVERIFQPEKSNNQILFDSDNVDCSQELFNWLVEQKYIRGDSDEHHNC